MLREFIELWFPPECARCARPGPSPCGTCLDDLQPADPFAVPRGLDSAAALLRYDDASRPFIASMKYRGRHTVAVDFARPLAVLVDEIVLGATAPVCTWAPTTRRRQRERGFDQAEMLARAVGREARLPVRRLLRRIGGVHQTGRDRRGRLAGIGFEPVGRVPPVVLVCDDVLTTGTTLTAAAGVLRSAGAREVHALALARTPLW